MIGEWVVCVDEIENWPEIGVKGRKYRVWLWDYNSDYHLIQYDDGSIRAGKKERFRPLSQIPIPLDSLI